MMKYLYATLAVIFGLISFLYIIGYLELLFGLIPTDIPIALEGTLEYFDVEAQLWGQDIGSILLTIACVFLSSFFYYWNNIIKIFF